MSAGKAMENERKFKSEGSGGTLRTQAEMQKDQIEVLEVIEKNLDYFKVDVDVLNGVNLKANSVEVVKRICNKLYSSYCCSFCKGKKSVSTNKCGHLFCVECAAEYIAARKKCEFCQVKVSKKRTLPSHKDLREVHNSFNVICCACKKEKRIQMTEGVCSHLCISCIQTCYQNFEDECPKCFSLLFTGENYEPYSGILRICEGCKVEKSYLLDNFHKFNCGHTLCGCCIEESIDRRMCKLCQTLLNQKEVLEFIRTVTEQCENCRQIVSVKYIHLKRCCKQYCCGECSHVCFNSSL